MARTTWSPTGLRDFKNILKEYRGLSTWAVGSAAVPFAASLASLGPPWPKGNVVLTGLLEMVALILVYQFVRRLPKKRVDRIIVASAVLLLCFSASYLTSAARFTFEAGPKHELKAKGYVCTPLALTMFPNDCPDLGIDALRKVEYEAGELWTAQSVRNVEFLLFALWSFAFLSLSTLIGSFIVFQNR